MKKKKRFRTVILLLLLAAVAGGSIYFYPVWKDAGVLQKVMAAGSFTCELEAELDRDALETGQVKLLENLAKLTGLEENALFRLRISAKVREDQIQAFIYPVGEPEPLIELYLSDELDAINETLPYNTIRRNLVGKYALLEHIMPEEIEAVYMTVEQAEQLFDLDLSGMREFRLPDFGAGQSAAGYFSMLVLAQKEETGQGRRYRIETEQAGLEIETVNAVTGGDTDREEGGSEDGKTVRITVELENPGALAEQQSELLSRLGIALPVRELQMLKRLFVIIEPGKDEPEAPARFVEQEKVDLIVEIRDMIRKLSGFFSSEESTL